ncbi:MAG: TonB family protein [Elusimicrobiota bacterium]
MTDIKIGFIISISIHFLFFLFLSRVSKSPSKIYYIPIQVIGANNTNNAGSVAETKSNDFPSAEKIERIKKAEDIKSGDIVASKIVSKKSKINKKDILKWNEKERIEKDKKKNTGTGFGSESNSGSESSTGSNNSVDVNAGNFPYVGYINVLRNKVAQNWNPSPYPSNNSKKVLVYFKIVKDGKIENLTIKESAGISFVDRSAIRAITNSTPFPPLPAGYADDYLGVYFMFELSGS